MRDKFDINSLPLGHKVRYGERYYILELDLSVALGLEDSGCKRCRFSSKTFQRCSLILDSLFGKNRWGCEGKRIFKEVKEDV